MLYKFLNFHGWLHFGAISGSTCVTFVDVIQDQSEIES